MIRHRTFWLTALLALPAACSADGEADRAVAGNKAVAPANETIAAENGAAENGAAENGAAASSGTARSEIAAATAASADCPYATRNFQATVRPAEAPSTGQELEISWESSLDAQRRLVEFDVVERTPLVVIELRPGTMTLEPEYPTWSNPGSMASHNPANTHAVMRCGGREIARVTIPRP